MNSRDSASTHICNFDDVFTPRPYCMLPFFRDKSRKFMRSVQAKGTAHRSSGHISTAFICYSRKPFYPYLQSLTKPQIGKGSKNAPLPLLALLKPVEVLNRCGKGRHN